MKSHKACYEALIAEETLIHTSGDEAYFNEDGALIDKNGNYMHGSFAWPEDWSIKQKLHEEWRNEYKDKDGKAYLCGDDYKSKYAAVRGAGSGCIRQVLMREVPQDE